MPATARERMQKKFKVKEIKKKEANEVLKLLDNPKICIGVYRKGKLIGTCVGYSVNKKEFKKEWKHLTNDMQTIMIWDIKILKKFDDEEMKWFLEGERFKISRKKFPKVAYSAMLRKKKKKKTS